MGQTLIGPLPTDAQLTVAQGQSIFDQINEFIHEQHHGKIEQVVLAMDAPDKLMFLHSETSTFSMKNFIWERRPACGNRLWAQWIWKKYLPPNISAFMWRMIRHGLPVDCSVETRGIQMVSRCRCCSQSQTESLQHLFVQSEIAMAVWKCFGEIFRLLTQFTSILQALNICMAPTSNNTQYGICRASVAVYIYREIWVRCAATFEAKAMRARAICLRVLQRVQLINLATTPTKGPSKIQENSLAKMGISRAKVRKKRGVWCKWDKPSPGWFKLNIDGSANDDAIMGGSIIRDHHGNLICAFSAFYGQGTNNLFALRDGLLMCLALNLERVRIESDFMIVVSAMST